MSKKPSASKPKPMTQEAKARIYEATARENGGTIPAESFAPEQHEQQIRQQNN